MRDQIWIDFCFQFQAPLIEACTDDSNYSLVSFIWKSMVETKSVIVRIPIDGSGIDEHNMTRFLDTDLWYNFSIAKRLSGSL